jgi:hypothetical protein
MRARMALPEVAKIILEFIDAPWPAARITVIVVRRVSLTD